VEGLAHPFDVFGVTDAGPGVFGEHEQRLEVFLVVTGARLAAADLS
jgi:hypothetical protein